MNSQAWIRTGRPVVLAVASLTMLGGAATSSAERITLIEGGRSAYTIVVPDEDPRERVGRAAAQLQQTLKEATGVELAIVKESKAPAGGPAIYLGRTKAARKRKLPIDALKGWAYRKKVVGRDLFLIGRDASVGIDSRPAVEYLGTLKAVLSLLHEEVGVRFLLPGANGVHVPRLRALSIPSDLDVAWEPVFLYSRGRPQGLVYDVANNQFPGGFYKSYGGHSYYRAVPKAKYGKTHPEYFALIGGVRNPMDNHLCISNPDVRKLMIEEMTRQLDAGYEWVQLAQTDGYVPCGCPKCSKISADKGERLLIYHRALAESMRERRPGKRIVILAPYGPVEQPPKTFGKFPDNVVLEMCRYSPEDFAKWRGRAKGIVVYIYNWGTYQVQGFAPKRTPAFVAEQLRLFARSGVRGIYKCGFGELLGLEGPVYYVFGRLMADPTQDANALADEFYRAAYGEACVPMKRFFDELHAQLDRFRDVEMPRDPEIAVMSLFHPKVLLRMAGRLELALSMDHPPREAARLRLVEREFRYLMNLSSVFFLYNAYRLNPSWETFRPLARAVERRNRMIDSFYDERGRMKRFDGWPRFFGNAPKAVLKTNGRLRATLGAPFNWDTGLLERKRVLPGVGRKTMKIGRIEGVVLDGRLAERTWAAAAAGAFVEISLGRLAEPTTVRVAYDDKALYFGFVCRASNAARMELNAVGRDGPAFRQECLEIFLDPFGSRQKYYHFIFNPLPNSRYDARAGFIADPLHPLFGQGDKSWNGRWQYAAHVDGAQGRWTAEVRIPFAALGTRRPARGATWCMNLGREHYRAGIRGPAELSLWSPNLESRSFHSVEAFGTLIFD